MRTILFILQKEFIQIFRNKSMLPLIFVAPIAQMVFLSYAANFEIKNITMTVVDQDLSTASRKLITKMQSSNYFILKSFSTSEKAGQAALESDKADMILQIPHNFEKDLVKENKAGLQLTVNAINTQKAGIAVNYANSIIVDFNRELREEWFQPGKSVGEASFDVQYANWFNPKLDYKTLMTPGILAELVSMIIVFLTAINIVKEKEIGTIEQLNVTPIRKYQFIIGKLLPFWCIAMCILTVGLIFGKLWFAIPFLGNVGVVFAFASVYLVAVLGIGLLISTISETQQQALFIAWFLAINFILLCGLFTAADNMPQWVQYLNIFNPIAYFVEVMRLVLLKGGGFKEISHQFYAACVYAVAVNSLAVWRYRKTA